jgi:hypothetical protein
VRTPAAQPSRESQSSSNATPSRAQAPVAARNSGSTAGVVQQGGQEVFASSTPPARTAAPARSRETTPARDNAPATSTRSATGDLWTGVTSAGTNPSLSSAASVGGSSGGLSGGAIAGMAILGLGLVAISGGALVATGRRRRASAGDTKR